jgi:hypothetical protein
VKREALKAGAKHEASDSGTKYASRTTFHASETLHAQSGGSAIAVDALVNNAGEGAVFQAGI